MNYATLAGCANVIDVDILNQLYIRNLDHTFFSFGEDMLSIIVTSLLRYLVTNKLDHRSLEDLNVRANYGCNIVGIQRQGTFIAFPPSEETIY